MTSLKSFTQNLLLLVAASLAAVFLFFMGAAVAANPIINGAKATCAIGETAEGYLAVKDRGAVSAEVQREMDRVNIERRSAYADLAKRNGVSVDAAARVTAERLINRAPAGHCYRDQNKRWVTK